MITNSITDIIGLVRSLIKDTLQNDGRNVFEFRTDSSFTISEVFVDEDTIKVYRNNVLLDEDDWSYNADTNRVEIDFVASGEALVKNDIIIITYGYYRRYSNSEIEGYIESSLGYFVQHKYKKVFEIINDKIYAENNVSPTLSEVHFIALIASISIDPQNVSVDTPEFKIKANRDESDQKQISKAFAQFKKFVGSVDFHVIAKDIY